MSAASPPRPPMRLMIVLGVALILPTLSTWIYFFQAAAASPTIQLTLYNLLKAVQFVLPIAWVIGVEKGTLARKSPSERSVAPRGVAVGLLLGLSIAAAIGGLAWWLLRDGPLNRVLCDAIRQKLSGFGIDSRLKYAGVGLFYSLVHSFLEEYYWRWFVFGQLRRIASVRAAAVVSSVGFMAHHVLVLGKFFGFDSWATWTFSAAICLGGTIWAYLYHWSGSLRGPWISHLLVDAAIFVVGYYLAGEILT